MALGCASMPLGLAIATFFSSLSWHRRDLICFCNENRIKIQRTRVISNRFINNYSIQATKNVFKFGWNTGYKGSHDVNFNSLPSASLSEFCRRFPRLSLGHSTCTCITKCHGSVVKFNFKFLCNLLYHSWVCMSKSAVPS